jgi:hypothetical protein
VQLHRQVPVKSAHSAARYENRWSAGMVNFLYTGVR